MKAGEIYAKTSKFMWMKLGLGLGMGLVSLLSFALLIGIGVLTKNIVVLYVMFLIWAGGILGLTRFINHYIGYLIKAGHVAVITEAVTSGKIPDNQFEFGKNAVKERFATSNVYFLVDKLVGGAVKQVQKVAGKLTGIVGNLPGMEKVADFLNTFIGIVLGYVDECCLGWTFYKKDENAFKAAADGVVIYFQNWKVILKSAAVTALLVMVITLVLGLVVYGVINGILVSIASSGVASDAQLVFIIFSLCLAANIVFSIKDAFVDSWILCKMMTTYMEVAPSTVITFDLYEKLSNFSSNFKKMFKRSGYTPEMATAAAGAGMAGVTAPVSNVEMNYATETVSTGTKYCPNCGNQLSSNAAFCGNCGTKQ